MATQTIEQSVEVEVPISRAYNQWTQFEDFPRFMEGVEEVRQTDDRHLHWVAEFGGERHEWDAEITEQKPEERVAWRNHDGKDTAGAVTFHKLSDDKTKVMVQMDWAPEGIKEKVGAVLGADDREGRPGALQGVHRVAWPGDRRVERRDPARVVSGDARPGSKGGRPRGGRRSWEATMPVWRPSL